mgnify:CR=1 FL=1
MATKGRTKSRKANSKPVNYNVPGFSATSTQRETAKKMVMSKLEKQGLKGKDKLDAYNRGKLTQNQSTGKYTYSTNAMSVASPVGRDVPLPKTK